MGSIFVDTKDAEKSTHKVGEDAEKTGGKFTSMAKKVGKAGVAIGAAAAAGGAALYGMANKAAGTTDRIDKMSQKMGLSRKSFQELDFVMSQSGLSIDSFGVGMKTLLNNMDGVSKGNAQATERFERLGVSVKDASGKLRSQDEVLYDTIKAMQKMEDGSEKAKLAQELFGKQGQEIMPLLNGQAGSFEELTEKANELGLVLGDDAVDAGVVLTDTIDQSQRALNSIITQIGVSVMPIVQGALEWVLEHMPEIKAVMSAVFSAIEVIVTAVATVFRVVLLPILEGIVDFIKQHFPQIQIVVETVMKAIQIVCKVVWGAIQNIFNTYGNSIMAIVKGAWTIISGIVQGAMKIIQGVIQIVMGIIQGDWSTVWNGIKNVMEGVWKAIGGIVKGSLSMIKGVITGTWNAIKSITVTVWNGIKTAITAPIRLAVDAVRTMINKMKGFFNFSWKLPHIKLPHFSVSGSANPINWLKDGVPKIRVNWYAEGGILEKPTIFGANGNSLMGGGEAGAEAVAPISKLQDYVKKAVLEVNSMSGVEERLDRLIELMSGILPALAQMGITLDTGQLVGALAPGINSAITKQELLGMRGV